MTLPDGWIFKDDEKSIKHKSLFPDYAEPYTLLTTKAQWLNFCDDGIYEFEKKLRDFLEWMSQSTTYRSTKRRRFTYKQIYTRLFGHEPEKLLGYTANSQRQVLAYYSTRILEDTCIEGKRYKMVYVLGISRRNKRPWGIRLRMEWYETHSEIITAEKLRLIRKTLPPGHARNPRTEKNIEKRRQRAREIYREKYNNPEYRAYLKERKQQEQRLAADLHSDGDDDR